MLKQHPQLNEAKATGTPNMLYCRTNCSVHRKPIHTVNVAYCRGILDQEGGSCKLIYVRPDFESEVYIYIHSIYSSHISTEKNSDSIK